MSLTIHHVPEPLEADFKMAAAGLDAFYTLPELKRDQAAGRIALYRAKYQDHSCAVLAIRIEATANGDELVVVSIGGVTPSAKMGLVRCFVPAIARLAGMLGCKTARAHTAKKGIARLMQAGGAQEAERVFRVGATHGGQIIQFKQ